MGIFDYNCKLSKPERPVDQLDIMWDFMTNHMWHKVCWTDTKLNFIMTFLALILGLLAVDIIR